VFKPFALFVGLRYTRAKRRNHFISFISLSSMLGIALGVAVLITVLSVMNGFDNEIRGRVLGMANQVTVSTMSGSVSHWQNLEDDLAHYPGVTGAAPFVQGQGILVNQGQTHPVMVFGISPQQEQNVSALAQKVTSGSFDSLTPGQYGVVLGEKLAATLGASVGDKVTLLIPSAAVTPVGIIPRFKVFTVAAVFKVGSGFGFDTDFAYINLKDAQTLFQFGSNVSGIRLKLQDFYAAPKISQELAQKYPPPYFISDWTQDYGSIFHAISMEKTMMFIILLLLVAIAAFNLVSTLVMVVNDKRSDIAILRTFGATPKMILTIFMVQGSIIGLVGTFLGLIGGVLLASHATQLVNLIESTLHVQLLSSDIYYVNYLPSKLQWLDVTHIAIAALLMSLVATLYPAWRAARTHPAEALRYE
jgi:lipoprotein-releasing system permease protein